MSKSMKGLVGIYNGPIDVLRGLKLEVVHQSPRIGGLACKVLETRRTYMAGTIIHIDAYEFQKQGTRMKMKTEDQIRERIMAIDADDRYHLESASVQVNAPLALIQAHLAATISALAWVLGEAPPKPGHRKLK